MHSVRFGVCVPVFLTPLAVLAAQAPWIEVGKRHLPLVPSTTRAIGVGDFDGDGHRDVFLGQVGPDRLLRNDGHGVFTDVTAGNLSPDGDAATVVVVGDVDGDRDLDVMVGAQGAVALRLYVNDGRGRFRDATAQVPSGLPGVADLELADVDADGDLDLVAVHFAPSFGASILPTRLYLNDGRGTFRDASSQVRQGPTFALALAVGDVDGDGDLDLVVANRPLQLKWSRLRGQELLYLNDGAGGFTVAPAAQLPLDDDVTLDLALVDVDGDGDLDLLGMNEAGNKLYRNDGRGTFIDVTVGRIPPDPAMKTRLAVADVDGDGDQDFVTAHLLWSGAAYVGAQNRLFSNDGLGTFRDATQTHLPARLDSTFAIALADLDGDGDPDLIAGNEGQLDALLLNDGASGFSDALRSRMPPEGMQATTVALGDVDGDGAPDLVLGGWGRGESRLYLNDRRGGFTDVTAQRWPGYHDTTAALLLADLDGDGDLDLVEGSYGPEVVYRNDGRGTFTVWWRSAAVDGTNALVVADVDGDGDLDLIVANGGTAVGPPIQDRLYLNQGNGTFVDVTGTHLPPDQDYTDSVVAGDIDGDGDMDLVFGSHELTPRLLLNDGRGRFSVRAPPAAAGAMVVASGDVDGDGDLDLACGSYGQPRLFRNVGNATFVDITAQAMPVLTLGTVAMAFHDLDQDGDLDLIVADGGFPYSARVEPTRILRNDGRGTFTDVTTLVVPMLTQVSDVAVGDVDDDGDVDIVFARFGRQSRLLVSTTRQLDGPWLARPGRPFALDVHAHDATGGVHDALVLLAARELSPPVLLPPFGRLQVDPTSLFATLPVAVPVGGPGRIAFTLPDDPAFTGVRFAAQALVWPRANPALLRLTNGSVDQVAPR